MRYPEFRAVSNFFLGPFSIYGLLPYKISRYPELRYLELIFWSLGRIAVAISNMRYLEFRAISSFFPGSFSIYGLLLYKMSRYPELLYLELFAISN